MKRKVLLTLALCAALGAILAQPAFCGWSWHVQKITEDGAWASTPKVWGDTVYYKDSQSSQNGYLEMKAWSPTQGTRTLIQVPMNTIPYSVYEQTLVYAKYDVTTKFDLYSWDPVNGERAISIAPGTQRNADVSGDTIVWEDYRSGTEQVWMYDPVNGARPISPTTSSQWNPRVDRGRVVWEDMRHGRGDVYMWTSQGGAQRLSTYLYPMQHPDVYGDRVVMYVPWQETMWDPWGIWEWNAGLGITGPLVPYSGGNARIWGDLLAWPGTGGMVAYHSSAGKSLLPSAYVTSFDVYGNSVVWADENYDIWMATLVPEPSSLLALVGFTGMLAFMRKRR